MTPEERKELEKTITDLQIPEADLAPQADAEVAEEVDQVDVAVPDLPDSNKASPVGDVLGIIDAGAADVSKQMQKADPFAAFDEDRNVQAAIQGPPPNAKQPQAAPVEAEPEEVVVPIPPPPAEKIPTMEEVVQEAKRKGAWNENEQVINWPKMIQQDDAKVGGNPIQQGAEVADARKEAEAAHKAMLDELVAFLRAIAQQDHQARLEILQMRKAAIRSRG